MSEVIMYQLCSYIARRFRPEPTLVKTVSFAKGDAGRALHQLATWVENLDKPPAFFTMETTRDGVSIQSLIATAGSIAMALHRISDRSDAEYPSLQWQMFFDKNAPWGNYDTEAPHPSPAPTAWE